MVIHAVNSGLAFLDHSGAKLASLSRGIGIVTTWDVMQQWKERRYQHL